MLVVYNGLAIFVGIRLLLKGMAASYAKSLQSLFVLSLLGSIVSLTLYNIIAFHFFGFLSNGTIHILTFGFFLEVLFGYVWISFRKEYISTMIGIVILCYFQ